MGISITVKRALLPEKESTSFIALDEIAGLLQGIDYLAKVTKDVSPLDNYEVQYKTRDDFELALGNGQSTVAISSGELPTISALIKMSDLQKLREYIIGARSKLQTAFPEAAKPKVNMARKLPVSDKTRKLTQIGKTF
jgi:hypothetical protein